MSCAQHPVRVLRDFTRVAAGAPLPDDVAAFLKKAEHREIQVDIEENFSRDIVRRLKEGSASLGVLWDGTDLDGLCKAPYRTDHLAVVVHPDHPLAGRRRCAFEETLDYEHVGLQASSAVNVTLARAAAVAGKSLRYRTQVSNFEASLRVVRANLSLSIIPQEIAASHAQVMPLRVIPLTNPWAKRQFVICFRQREALTPAAAMLLDSLVDAAKG